MTQHRLLTNHLPGTGGKLKAEPGHFIVEELPLYAPTGAGEHVYLNIVREDWTTRKLVEAMGRLFQLKDKDIGTAGLKDRQARAGQMFSLHLHKTPPDEVAARVQGELGVEVRSASRHANKLKTGHLKANRFEILLTDTHPDALERARHKWEHLQKQQIPNYYGEQRFGKDADNAQRG